MSRLPRYLGRATESAPWPFWPAIIAVVVCFALSDLVDAIPAVAR